MSRIASQWVFAGLLAMCFVSALNPHLNITFSETVYQNVTFAKDFLLVENRTYSLIEGVITIENPGAETVFDSYIKINNTENLVTNITYASGRFGTEIIYPKNSDVSGNLSLVINTTFQSLGADIDEDGTNDFVRINATHIIFNATSEFDLLAYQLFNSSGAANTSVANQAYSGVLINVTSIKIDGNYNDNVVFATLYINGTQTTANQLNASLINLTFNDTARPYAVLHIPELRSAQQSVFGYNVSSLLVEPPLDINTTYTNALYQTKVLAGQLFNVTDYASNIASVGDLIILNISINGMNVTVENSSGYNETFYFTLHNLSATGDYQYVYGNGTDNLSWSWVANNGTIPIGQTFNISYQVRAPDTVPTSGTYPAVEQNLTYTINATASTVGVVDVRVRADVNFTTSKQIISPQDNLSNNNVTWQSVPSVATVQNITFTLEKVTLWVTSARDPNQIAYSLNTTYTPSSTVDQSTVWTGGAWTFNFTDGSDELTAPPPIIWVKPYWIITNTGGQVLNQSITHNGTDTYIKYIYVVNGYWLEVYKNVTSTSNSSYDLKIWVHNRGNGHTPQDMTVTVYDFIPSAFTAYGFSPNYNNLSNVSGQYTGVAYQWDVGLRTNLSTSFAPEGDINDWDEYYLNYSVNGTGNFQVSDLYIVGLDPRKVDGAGTHEGISVLSGIASTSKELIYAAIVLFLVAINVGNFLMTSRINKKLDKKE